MNGEHDVHPTGDGSAEAPAPRAIGELANELRLLGIARIRSFAWRDLEDPEAGGSEVHADEILSRWAAAGLEVEHRTSTADRPRRLVRHGYRVEQRGGRFGVFARVAVRESLRRTPSEVAVVEIWNGVPWWSPVWHRGPRVTWLHHVHDRMWFDVLPAPVAHVGRSIEMRIAPRVYRHGRIVTLSDSSAEHVTALGIPVEHVTVIPPGVGAHFTPDPARRSAHPSVVVAGRLAPVKRIERALVAVEQARRDHPGLTVDVVGDGPERERLTRWVRERDAADWVHLRGRVDDDELVDAYRRAWVVLGASYAEGWGMSLTEAAACATPAVATDIAGHRGAVLPDVTGVLVPDVDALGAALADLLSDHDRRDRMGRAALAAAGRLSWDAVAARQLDVLVAETRLRRGPDARRRRSAR